MNWDKVREKVRQGTRFGQDLYWWYNAGKKVFSKAKDLYDQYYDSFPGPHLRNAFDQPIDFGIPVMDNFIVCLIKVRVRVRVRIEGRVRVWA